MNYVPLPRAVVPIVAVATVVVLAWVGWESVLSPEAFWAPGDLSQYHATVERCVFCHEPFQGPSPVKCQACHYAEDFAARSEPTVRDHHLEVIDQRKTCMACHTEHRGTLAEITTGVLPVSKDRVRPGKESGAVHGATQAYVRGQAGRNAADTQTRGDGVASLARVVSNSNQRQ